TRVLLTTRDEEVARRLGCAPLAVPGGDAALAVLAAHAGAALVEDQARGARALTELLGELPLALAVAGRLARAGDDFGAVVRALAAGDREAGPVMAALEARWARLDGAAQQALCALGLPGVSSLSPGGLAAAMGL